MAHAPVDLHVFSNPFQSTVSISGAGQNFTLVIHDASDKMLLSTQEAVVNLSHLEPGVYLLRLEGNSGHRTQKLIKH